MKTIDITQIDLCYEHYRLRDANRERGLLPSILESGVIEPLVGVLQLSGQLILLDGFKRYRCAKKLSIQTIPYVSIGEDTASGIIQLIRTSNAKSLHLIEQAKLVDDLRNTHRMGVVEIAQKLERSPAWVSVRLGLFNEMGEELKERVFSGKFPVRSYMYTIRHFTRVKKVPPKEVHEFVEIVGGKSLSTRDIDLLARGYFEGGSDLKDQIRVGNFRDTLEYLKRTTPEYNESGNELNEQEKGFIRDLEIVQKYERKIIHRYNDERLTRGSFFAEAGLFAGGIISQLDNYTKSIRSFYDRCRQAQSHMGVISGIKESKANSKTTGN